MTDFVHLHVHTEYSLLDGASRIGDLISYAKSLGQKAIAITDHGVMYGVVDFYKKAKKEGIKPIIGCELYIAQGDLHDKSAVRGDYSHLILLAKNNEGYKNLMQLCSIGFLEGFHYKPRIDHEVLRQYSSGLICFSACLSGEVPSLLLQGRREEAYAAARRYRDIFGKDFYIELQDHDLLDQKRVNPLLIQLAEELGLPMVVSNDVHYVRKEDARAQETLTCLQMGRTLEEGGLMDTDEFYLKDGDAMAALFPHLPGAIENTLRIAEECDVTLDLDTIHLPDFEVPPQYATHEAYLEKLTRDGIARRYADPAAVEERVAYELSTISNMGFTDYFLIVWDYVRFAKSSGIMVGPGRGSAAGSIVAYALEITDIDPIRYNLLFERFLNPGRVSMPDIDIDFCIERRKEVIDYVAAKYGQDHVAQVITFGTMGARLVVRDVARVLHIPPAEADRIAKMVPFAPKMTIPKALEESPRLAAEYENDRQVHDWLDMAMKLEGIPRQSGTHAAAVVITKEPVIAYSPLALNKKDESVTTQYHMNNISDLGLLKMDFLGLRTLTVIRDTLAMVKENHGVAIDFSAMPMDDPKVYEMLSQGETDGVFQLESEGMRNLMTRLRPAALGDIMVGSALFRPGPMAKIPEYIEGKNHPEKVRYLHPCLEPILKDTYGCMVYQEQVMEIVRAMAGYSMARSDDVRRTMSKKKVEAMEKERQIFIHGGDGVPGALKNGVSEKIAAEVFDQMMDFAQYAFNKSHACAYAVVAYQTAYLKRYYEPEFMTAILNSFIDHSDRLSHYMRYLTRRGIPILPPDINLSDRLFTTDGKSIRFGLSALSNVGGSIIAALDEREGGGLYADFDDFIRRNCLSVNKSQLESLILSGCFDSMGARRSQLMAIYEIAVKNAQADARLAASGQMSLFQMSSEPGSYGRTPLPDLPEFALRQKLSLEKSRAGLYLSGHPLDPYADRLKSRFPTTAHIRAAVDGNGRPHDYDGDVVELIGIFTALKTRTTKQTRQMMASGVFEDLEGSLDATVFPKNFAAFGALLNTDDPFLLRCRVTLREDQPELLVEDARPYNASAAQAAQQPAAAPGPKRLYLRCEADDAALRQVIGRLLQRYPGGIDARLKVASTGQVYALGVASSGAPALLDELTMLLGAGNVVLQ